MHEAATPLLRAVAGGEGGGGAPWPRPWLPRRAAGRALRLQRLRPGRRGQPR